MLSLFSPPLQHSHVPKFGNWEEANNIPYTAYFENPRREKAGFLINPNDPIENPEAFNMCMGGNFQNVDADKLKFSHTYSHNQSSLEKRNHTGPHVHQRSKGSQGSFTSDHKRSMSKGGSIIRGFSSSSHNRHGSGDHSFDDPHMNHQATAIPKFGTWDVTDPKSGEGYTAIFSKIREEKQFAPSHISGQSNVPLNYHSNSKNEHSFRLSKYCCCFCSSGTK